MIFQNKHGADKVLSVYWFVIIVLVAGGIFSMVYVFYGAPYDIREIENDIFADKLADCISRNGQMNEELFNGGELNETFNFEKRCNFNFKTEDETLQYFLEVEIYEVNDLENPEFVSSNGNINFRSDCFIKDEDEKDYENLPKCKNRRFYSVNSGSQYLIKILTAVGKSEKNVKR